MELRNLPLTVALVVLMAGSLLGASAPKATNSAPVGQFHLLEKLRDHGDSPSALVLDDVVASNGDLFFFAKAQPSRSAPAAFVRTSSSGEVRAFVTLDSSDELAMDVTGDGRVVAADFGLENLLVFDREGNLESSIPLEISIGSWCDAESELSRLCLLLDGRLPESLLKTPPLMLRVGLSGGGFAVVDGLEAVLHLGDRTTLQPGPIHLSNPTLDPVREVVAVETEKDNSKAVLIMDAESYDDAIYLLLGSGTRAGEGVVMRYSRAGDYLGSQTYRVNMMPQFLAVEAGRLYLSDHLGNVAVYALP